jgi:XRE family aerobic/anaerobic benzoate catabolism transcriptional regulator
MLRALGAAVRARRTERRLTLRALAELCSLSERFLVQLETGEGNISVVRLQDVAEALGTSASMLLAQAMEAKEDRAPKKRAKPAPTIVSLLGLRGAGKTTVGAALAKRLRVPFVELDALVAREAGMDLAAIFEIHGESYYRRVEREALEKLLGAGEGCVVATGGSLVTAPETYALLRKKTVTVWLRAKARDHWNRVVAQGDARPMKDRANAMSELKALLRARKSLYEQAAHVVDTSGVTPEQAIKRVLLAVEKT